MPTKSERRETLRRKQKNAPKGATRGAQSQKQKTTRNFHGRTKKLIKKST